LSFHVLGLHVTNCNYHDLIIDWVINMIDHSRPSLNTFYVIEHHPCNLQIITRLHSPNQIKFKCNSINEHLE
jgi:hypothetical protein